MLASCYESCWAATRYGVEHSHGVGRQTTSIQQWNVSTCLDGWIGYRVCCPVACLAVCRCTGAFLTDASLAWPGLRRCANTITLRGRVDRVVTKFRSFGAMTASDNQASHAGIERSGRYSVPHHSTSNYSSHTPLHHCRYTAAATPQPLHPRRYTPAATHPPLHHRRYTTAATHPPLHTRRYN